MKDEKRYFTAGIDEAGYSPRLGPLVISAMVFETAAPGMCLWQALEPLVARTRCRNDNVIAVNDSKKVFNRATGLSTLERSVLAFLPGYSRRKNFYDLLGEIARDWRPDGEFYDAADVVLPADCDADDIAALREALARQMRAARVALRTATALPIHPCRMGRLLDGTANKSVMLFEEVAGLLRAMIERYGRHELEIVADKQGGRHYYGNLLAMAFPMARIGVLQEGPACSTYEIETPQGRARLSFRAKGDSAHLPTALASMLSKYVREIFMERFNRYWERLVPGIRPTAGYPRDAARFLDEIDPHLKNGNFEMRTLVRYK